MYDTFLAPCFAFGRRRLATGETESTRRHSRTLVREIFYSA